MLEFYNIFNNSPLPIYVLQGGFFQQVNPRMVEITGYPREELLKMPFSELIHPEDRALVTDNALRRLNGEKVEDQYSFRAVNRAGDVVYLLGFFSVIEYKGTPATLGQIMDVTQQKKAEDSLRESEERYRNILESIEDGYFEVDLAGNLTFENEALSRITGYSPGEKQGMSYREYTDAENAEKIFKTFNRVYKTGNSVKLFDWQIIRPDGSRRHVETSVSLRRQWTGGEPVGFRGILRDITERKKAEAALSEERERLRVTISSIGDAVMAVDLAGKVTLLNPVAETLTGWSEAEAVGRHVDEVFCIINENTREPAVNPLGRVLTEGKIMGLANHTALIGRDGSQRSIADSAAPIRDEEGNILGAILVFRDVTEERRWEQALAASEEMYRTIFETTGTAMVIVEEDTTISLANRELETLTGYRREEVEGKRSWLEFVAPRDREMMARFHRQRREDGNFAPRSYDFSLLDRQRNQRHVILTVSIIPGTQKSVASILDITRRKQLEEKLHYLSLHDPLTGLYNRNYFQEEMHRMDRDNLCPAGIMVCDVDGLKLVNDTLGHKKGDELLGIAANAIRGALRRGDMVARIGGDEFAVMVPGGSRKDLENIARRVKEAVDGYNARKHSVSLSISMGFAVREDCRERMDDLFKRADNNMYREKLHRKQSARSAIVQTLLRALEARDFITEGHGERLQELTVFLARAAGMSERKFTDLRLLAQFHDIGKVGIPDRILFKKGILTAEEMTEMKRHSEIGHRIALSAPDLVPIADWILKHHEWWNGKGYPLGLAGNDIPLECRILSIADAYDAMTNDRPYRKALSSAEAVRELKRCAGSQFDPELVPKFLDVLEKVI